MILAPLQKLPKNVEDLGKLIVAKGFKKLPKVQKSPTLVTLIVGEQAKHSTSAPIELAILIKTRIAYN